MFPRWELLESRKESISIAVADAEKVVSGRRESRKVTLACLEIFVFIKKTSIPPVNGLEAPKIKDSLIFIPPLIPPVISPISLPPVDLNYDNKDMREAMIDAMKFWIVEVGIDGFRCDVADGVPADFWKEALEQLRAAAGDRKIVMLAEGKNEDNFTVGGFDMNYGWDYKDEIVKVWKGAPASDLIKADSAEYANLPAGKVKLRFTTNYDHSTEATPCVEFTNERGAMAAYVASIFPHGGALIYCSQEVSYPEPINFFKYVPVDWTANSAIYQEYKELIELYNEHPALRKGKMIAWPDNDVLIFEKSDAEESFLVIVNVRNEQKAVQIPESWVGRETEDEVTDKDFKLESTLTLEPFQYLILE